MVVVVVNKGHNYIPFQYTHKQSEQNGRMKNSERRLQLTYFFSNTKHLNKILQKFLKVTQLYAYVTRTTNLRNLIDFRRLRCGFLFIVYLILEYRDKMKASTYKCTHQNSPANICNSA